MNAPRVSSLHDIRHFLSRYQDAPEPWASSEQALDRLYGLLLERQSDDAFWRDLAGLVRCLEDQQLRASLLASAEEMEPQATDALLVALRAALRKANGPSQARAAFARSCRTAPPLAGFLLLGLAVACTDKAEEAGLCQEAEDLSLGADEGQVYCELIDMIDASNINEYDKESLLECLPDMTHAEWEDLLSDWAEMSEGEVLDEMGNLAWSDCTERSGGDVH
jgi:hypothetical protein